MGAISSVAEREDRKKTLDMNNYILIKIKLKEALNGIDDTDPPAFWKEINDLVNYVSESFDILTDSSMKGEAEMMFEQKKDILNEMIRNEIRTIQDYKKHLDIIRKTYFSDRIEDMYRIMVNDPDNNTETTYFFLRKFFVDLYEKALELGYITKKLSDRENGIEEESDQLKIDVYSKLNRNQTDLFIKNLRKRFPQAAIKFSNDEREMFNVPRKDRIALVLKHIEDFDNSRKYNVQDYVYRHNYSKIVIVDFQYSHSEDSDFFIVDKQKKIYYYRMITTSYSPDSIVSSVANSEFETLSNKIGRSFLKMK